MFSKSVQLTGIGVCLLLVTGFAGLSYAQDEVDEALPLGDLRIFSEVFGKIKSEYVDPVDDSTLLKGAIHGMVRELDPHSSFLEPEELKELRITTDGKFGGLGIEVTIEDGLIKVISPMDSTPAFHAGIQPGDLILMLDGAPVQGMNLKEAVDKMRGPPGSEIRLTISREGEPDSIEVTLVRAIIKAASVKAQLLQAGFGYARLSSFQSGSAQSLRTKIAELKNRNGGALEGFVLDLRNNSGGVLNGAVEVSDLFLSGGEIVSTRGRTELSAQSYTALPDDVIDGAPMVVLVNGGSASASEIVSGALQDHQRAIIMGTKTFGKGSVQTIIPMDNRGALKITTARYYTPLNRSIQAIGITPDIVTEQTEFAKVQSNQPAVRESDLVDHLDSEGGSDEAAPPILSNLELIDNDNQLKEAFNLLKGMALIQKRAKTSG